MTFTFMMRYFSIAPLRATSYRFIRLIMLIFKKLNCQRLPHWCGDTDYKCMWSRCCAFTRSDVTGNLPHIEKTGPKLMYSIMSSLCHLWGNKKCVMKDMPFTISMSLKKMCNRMKKRGGRMRGLKGGMRKDERMKRREEEGWEDEKDGGGRMRGWKGGRRKDENGGEGDIHGIYNFPYLAFHMDNKNYNDKYKYSFI